MKYAIIKNNLVDNIIIADQDFINAHYPDAILLSDNDVVGPNYIYQNGQFIEPEPTPIEEPVSE